MKILLAFLTTVLCLSAFAQNAPINDPNVKARALTGSFSAISVSDGITLYLTSGSEESVAVSSADEKHEARFKTEVVDNVLKIYYDNKGMNYKDDKRRQLKAYVSCKTLVKLSASGGASVKLYSPIGVDKLKMNFTSGSQFEGEINGKEISVDQSSGSIVRMNGKSEKLIVETGSGASFKGKKFSTEYCEAKASSGGGISVSVGKELTAQARSGGDIRYTGTPVIKEVNISSGGVIKKA